MHLQKKILIIDDEADLCMLLNDYFTRKQYLVSVCNTLSEGRKLLDELNPDILFLDNNLPDGTGWNTAPDIAAQYPDLYVVLVSAFHPEKPVMPAGTKYRVIEKPIRLADLEMEFPALTV